jgi:hypothetical protein
VTASAAVERAIYAAAGVAFALVATANAGMYRFGVSDQAFYIPVVTRALDPAAFPRDAALIDAQGRLMLTDELLALVARTTTLPLETIFLAVYLLSLALTWIAVVLIGQRVYANRWTTLALGAACTLRHRITRTSANSFEPYLHPRMLAFSVGLLAIAAFLRRRHFVAAGLVLLAAAIHVTTGAWFGVLIGVALVVMEPAWRRVAVPVGLAVTAAGLWALVAGPLRGRLVVMDDLWLQAVASKDSLFASQWPLSAWLANLGLLAVLWGAYLWRRSQARTTAEERALVWGATALVGLFLLTLPAVTAGVALAVQLQISRVFWLVDFVATVYVVAAVGAVGAGSRRRPAGAGAAGRPVLAAVLAAVAVTRGGYILFVEHPERPLFDMRLPATPWTEAMGWLALQPKDIHVLADPGHAWRYGSSVRVAAGRDVYLEETKDSAVAIYSRDIAARVVERTAALGDFRHLPVDALTRLGERYGLTHVVTEDRLALPMLFENRQFRIYALIPPTRLASGPRAQ